MAVQYTVQLQVEEDPTGVKNTGEKVHKTVSWLTVLTWTGEGGMDLKSLPNFRHSNSVLYGGSMNCECQEAQFLNDNGKKKLVDD